MNATEYQLASERQCLRLLRASRDGEGGRTLGELADDTTIDLGKVRLLARRLVKEDLWVKQGRGARARYALTPSGQAAVSRIRSAGVTLVPHSCAHQLLAVASEKPLSAAELLRRARARGMPISYTDLVIDGALDALLKARYLRRVGEKQYILLPAGGQLLTRLEAKIRTATLQKHKETR